jgi:hypothetical protein
MSKQSKPLREVIEAKARDDGRYAIAWATLQQSDELRAAIRGIGTSINQLADAIQRMRPMVTVETAPVPAKASVPPRGNAGGATAESADMTKASEAWRDI